MTDRKGTPSYQKNFQTKKRRRREGKTDYARRRKLIRKDVNNYTDEKYRLVVRLTNRRVFVSVVKCCMGGDQVVGHADSFELKKYGVTFGLSNHFACYATGRLCAKRVIDAHNKKCAESGEEAKPFTAFLDIGLANPTFDCNVYVAMRGAFDAGMHVPHGEKVLAGFDEESGLDNEVFMSRVFMEPLCDYMKQLREEDEELYKKRFGSYVKQDVTPEKVKSIYEEALKKIDTDFVKEKKEKKDYSEFKKYKVAKLTLEERKARIAAKLLAAAQEE